MNLFILFQYIIRMSIRHITQYTVTMVGKKLACVLPLQMISMVIHKTNLLGIFPG